MEATGINWNKKATVGTSLLFMCLLISPLALSQTEEAHTCRPDDYITDKGICCDKCHKGYHLVEECQAAGQRSNCKVCPSGQYMNEINFAPNCRRCRRCKTSKHEKEKSGCERDKDTVCECEDGFYKYNINSQTYECRRCSQCRADEKETQRCTREKNTVCECKEDSYRVNNKCEPCKICSSECNNHCKTLTTVNGKDPDKEGFINIIAGVGATVLVLFGLVVVITHVVTKWFTKKKLLKASSQPTDLSVDSSEVLIKCEENVSDTSVQAEPEGLVSEQPQSNLPDCVPLEIKIAELIYTVLDLVPVMQVKQLVRRLGVKDTEIEQAELDYRPCREAHYQMLRLWAERGSPAGAGGRGGMLHMPLLQELLDKLRIMLLGGVAEELETKYGIQ